MADAPVSGDPTARRASRKVDVFVAILLSCAALGVRLNHLSDAGLWEDEAFRFDLAVGSVTHLAVSRSSLPYVFQNQPQEPAPLATIEQSLVMVRDHSPYGPVFPTILHLMMMGGASDPSTLMLFNAFCAAMTALLIYAFGRWGLSVSAAAAGTLLFIFSPWDIGVGMQLKETPLATTMGLLTTCLLVLALESRKKRHWAIYGVALGASFLVQQQMVFLTPIHGVLVLLSAKPMRQWFFRVVGAWVLAGLVYVPWFAWAGRNQLAHINAGKAYGGDWGALAGLPERWLTYLGDSLAPAGPTLARSPFLLGALVLGVLGVFLVRFFRALRRSRQAEPVRWPANALDITAAGGFFWLGGLLLGTATYLLAQQNQALWPRYSPPYLPGLWLAVGGLLEWSREQLVRNKSSWLGAPARAWVGHALVVGAALGVGMLLLPHPERALPLDRYADWRGVTTALAREASDGDLVVHSPGGGAFDAFVHSWPRATRHVMLANSTPEQRAEVLALAAGRPVWIVSSWGFTGDAADWDAFFAAAGWTRREVSVLPDAEPQREGEMAVGVSANSAQLHAVGYLPPKALPAN